MTRANRQLIPASAARRLDYRERHCAAPREQSSDGETSQPPIILSSQLGFSPETQNQMTAVSLIASGILSCVQMTRFRIPRTKFYVGTGQSHVQSVHACQSDRLSCVQVSSRLLVRPRTRYA